MKPLQTLVVLIALLAITGIRPSYGQTPSSYYFDSEKGNDKITKCDISHPFQSLAKADSLVLKPGDQIFFKRGGYWRGQLHPKGSGSASSPIKIDCYGNGDDPLPLIEGAGAESAVLLDNQQNWIISNIAISNLTSDIKGIHHGILVRGTNIGELNNIRIENVRVYEVQGNGRSNGIYAQAGGKTVSTWFNNLVINNCRVDKVPNNGIIVTGGSSGNMPRGQWGFVTAKNVIISNNVVFDAGWSGILIYSSDAPLLTHNIVAGSNWNYETTNALGIGLWVYQSIDAMQEYNEVFDTQEPYNGRNNDVDGNAFDISRSLHATYRYNFTHDNNGGFMLIDNYLNPSYFKGNIVHDNLSLNDEMELFQLGGNNTTRIYNNIFHTGKGLDYRPSTFFSNPAGTPTDIGNIAEPSNDILVTGNVFSAEPGANKGYAINPGRIDFTGWIDTTGLLNGILGGIDFGQNVWLRGKTNEETNNRLWDITSGLMEWKVRFGDLYMFLNKKEPTGSGTIDFSPRGITLHSIDIAGAGTVVLSSGNPGNPPVTCILKAPRNQYQTFETKWRFPAGVVGFEINNPEGVSQTRFENIEYYKQGLTFTHNYFLNIPEPADTVHKGYIENFNNKVLSGQSELPFDKAARLDSLISRKYYAINFLAKEIPTDKWINKSYKGGKEVVAKIDGEPIYAVELSLAMEELRPAVLAMTKSAMNSNEADKTLGEKAMQLCYRRKMEQIIARERGLIKETNIFALLLDIEQQNIRHSQKGNLFFGPEILNPAACLSYYHRNLTILLPRLMREEFKPTDKDIDEQFEKQKLRKGVYSEVFNDRSANLAGLAKDAVKQKFEGFVEQRVAKAKISDTK